MADKSSQCISKPLLFAIAAILVLVIGWHLLFPFLPIALTVTATVWGVVIATVAALCITIVMFLVFSGIGMLLLGFFVFAWTMTAISFFPVIFPLLAPLLVMLLFIIFWRRSKARFKSQY